MRDARLLPASLAVALLAAGVFVTAVIAAQALPDGPVPVAWDRAACGHCRMHVSEPAFAAQLQTREGDVFDYDDPGCLLRHVAASAPRVHAIYFHHHTEDRWIDARAVGFLAVPGGSTPMGFGLAAVDADTRGAMTLAEAQRRAARDGDSR